MIKPYLKMKMVRKDFGETTMTLKEAGTFFCSWQNIGNVLFRIGKRWNGTKTYQEIGKIKVNYEFDFISINKSHYGIYGFTHYPLVEYYILENYEGYIPSPFFGTFHVDGSNYDMFKDNFILTNQIMTRIWSIRRKKRNKGSVSVTEHFKTREKYGYKLGKIYEVSFCVEGYKGFGNANITKNEIIIE